ncbi:MAG: MJ0042-type zinc finger domain-containing protein [Candidatus Deferrimicrobiaceae bacterium]
MQVPPIVIECDACKTRYLLDRKLVQGYRAAQVRCRNCGGPIRITIPEPPILDGSPPARTRRDPAEAQPPRVAAPAPPRVERRAAGRTTRSSAVAQSLLEEESETGATPNNLVNIQKFREFGRGRITAGSSDITQNITAEIPHAELPAPEAIPEAEPRSPADSPAAQPVPGKPSSTGGSRTFEEPFHPGGEKPVTLPQAPEKSLPSPSASRYRGFWRRRTRRFGPSTTFLLVVFGTTSSILFFILLMRLLLQFTNWIQLYKG